MTKRQYVYTVRMEYDAWDGYGVGIADSLPVAKRLAQSDYDARNTRDDVTDKVPPLKFDRRVSAIAGYLHRIYWVAPAPSDYGSGYEYRIHKQAVHNTRSVP